MGYFARILDKFHIRKGLYDPLAYLQSPIDNKLGLCDYSTRIMGERIRIIETPPGQAPNWVRKEWVGLELPVAEDTPTPKEGCQLGARLGKPENLGGYSVKTLAALDALNRKSPLAASWWKRNIIPEVFPWLVFKREVCELLPEDPIN